MKNFEYAHPRTEAEAIELLTQGRGESAVLAGGTDLIGLMKKMVISPTRVVNISDVDSMNRIEQDALGGVSIGAGVHLDDFVHSRLTATYPALKQVIHGISSIQLQSQGTIGGELLRRPDCWYFRSGHGLLADSGRMVVDGDNRLHAILGNRGPAKFVNPSRLAPALISLRAQVRVIGPEPEQEQFLPVEMLYRTPRNEEDREHVLQPNQLVTHILLPPDDGSLSAAYEVRHGEGPEPPLAAAAASLRVVAGVVRQARIVLGQVAPIPWISEGAANTLLGSTISEDSAQQAGQAAVRDARPLSENEYKIQLAQVAVKRSILRAAGLETGGF